MKKQHNLWVQLSDSEREKLDSKEAIKQYKIKAKQEINSQDRNSYEEEHKTLRMNREAIPNEMNGIEALKYMKSIIWPKHHSSAHTFRRMFKSKMKDAMMDGVPERYVRMSAMQQLHANSSTMASFERLTQNTEIKTVKDVKDVLDIISVEERALTKEEQFREIKSFEWESAFLYMERLKCQFTDIFSDTIDGRRVISKQFLENFQRKNNKLSESHKQALKFGTHTEMAFHAEKIITVLCGETITGNKVCYRCSSEEHIAKNCDLKRYCAACQCNAVHTTKNHS